MLGSFVYWGRDGDEDMQGKAYRLSLNLGLWTNVILG